MHPLVDKRLFLGAHPLFEELSSVNMTELPAITHEIKVPAKHCLIKQGDPGEDMYIVVQGKLSVYIHIADNEDIKVGELSEGEAFGEIALFDEEPRTASIVTVDVCKLLVIQRDPFRQFLLDNPKISLEMLTVMSRRLRSTYDFLRDSLHDDISIRLADTLRKIAGAYGRQTKNGLVIGMSFDDTELGNISGIPKNVVTAQLNHWKKSGLITVKHGCLTLHRPDELAMLE
ncbi:MAG: Crp/Fnr family transcriptional regulator [Thiohalomonadales bacterium]